MFTTLGYDWPGKTLDPGHFALKPFGMLGWVCLCLQSCVCVEFHCHLRFEDQWILKTRERNYIDKNISE